MRTNDDGDPDFADILESGKVEIGRYARMEAAGSGIVIDGAVEYSLRLTPSNRILGRFASTREAWPAVLAAAERGMPPKCLNILDWHWANGRRGRVSSGRLLVSTARSGLGLDVEQDRVRTAS
jgi:hypothetical protein